MAVFSAEWRNLECPSGGSWGSGGSGGSDDIPKDVNTIADSLAAAAVSYTLQLSWYKRLSQNCQLHFNSMELRGYKTSVFLYIVALSSKHTNHKMFVRLPSTDKPYTTWENLG